MLYDQILGLSQGRANLAAARFKYNLAELLCETINEWLYDEGKSLITTKEAKEISERSGVPIDQGFSATRTFDFTDVDIETLIRLLAYFDKEVPEIHELVPFGTNRLESKNFSETPIPSE